jgi:hypothetical protein
MAEGICNRRGRRNEKGFKQNGKNRERGESWMKHFSRGCPNSSNVESVDKY